MDVVNSVLLNLKIISKIPENCRIKRGNGIISLDTGNFLFIKRFLLGDSRERALADINVTIDFAIEKCNDIINSRFFKKNHRYLLIDDSFISEKIDDEYMRQYELLEVIYDDLKASINGLVNLKRTYSSDTITTSKLDLIMIKIKNHITSLEKKIFVGNNSSFDTSVDSSVRQHHSPPSEPVDIQRRNLPGTSSHNEPESIHSQENMSAFKNYSEFDEPKFEHKKKKKKFNNSHQFDNSSEPLEVVPTKNSSIIHHVSTMECD